MDRRSCSDCSVERVRPDSLRFERRAAAAFIVAMAPLVVGIIAAGGLVALAPLVAIVVPMLALGIVPGFALLDEACRRISELPRASRPDHGVLRPASADPRPVSRAIRSLADRGPPPRFGLIAQRRCAREAIG